MKENISDKGTTLRVIFLLSGVSAALWTIFKMRNVGRLWVLPVSFLVFCAVYALLFWLILGLLSLGISMDREYEKPSPFYYWLLNEAYGFLCGGGRVHIHTAGMRKLPKDERFLLVSNHRSRFDPMAQSFVLRDTPIAFISKPSNFKIPAGRRLMRRSCYMAIDREHPRNALLIINHAAELIKTGAASVGVYPEGKRGDGSELQPFKAGCLKIATKSGCPIVVAAISGTEQIHRRFPFKSTEVYFDILDVIYPNGRKTTDLSAEIRDIMQKDLEKRGMKK